MAFKKSLFALTHCLIVWVTFQQQDLCRQQTDEQNCIEQQDGDH